MRDKSIEPMLVQIADMIDFFAAEFETTFTAKEKVQLAAGLYIDMLTKISAANKPVQRVEIAWPKEPR